MSRPKRTKEQLKYDLDTKTKICTGCGERKSHDDFYSSKSRTIDGLDCYCKPCSVKRKQEHYNKNRELNQRKYRDWRLQRIYNISLEDYEKILESQNNKCKICGAEENLSGAHHKIGHKNLVVDHGHATNKIRGLLCDKCNRGLGSFNDDIELLAKAIEYLTT